MTLLRSASGPATITQFRRDPPNPCTMTIGGTPAGPPKSTQCRGPSRSLNWPAPSHGRASCGRVIYPFLLVRLRRRGELPALSTAWPPCRDRCNALREPAPDVDTERDDGKVTPSLSGTTNDPSAAPASTIRLTCRVSPDRNVRLGDRNRLWCQTPMMGCAVSQQRSAARRVSTCPRTPARPRRSPKG